MACLLALPGPVVAANRALLVGVADYPKDKVGDLQLPGARNDVALMLRTLRDLGFADADMIVLADNFSESGEKRPANGEPTRAAILSALDDLAKTATRGDQIVIVLSGHGSLSPITDKASLIHHPDGLNPIFLPIDIGKWNDTVGAVENAIAGDEFGVKLAAIRKSGAFVWVIVDACHSGTITRGAETGVVAKQISPAMLGIPAARLDAARKLASDARPQSRSLASPGPARASSPLAAMPAAEGGYAAFFAAHPDELAIQRNLPKGYGVEDKRPHGVLVFYLAQALRSGRAKTYGDLAQMVLAGYDQWGASAPSPLFEGDLQRGILGGGDGAMRVLPARVTNGRLILEAGLLDDIAPGALVSLSRTGELEELGHASVKSSSTSSAVLEPASHEGKPAVSLTALEEAGRLSARVIERGMPLDLRIGISAEAADASPEEKLARNALVALAGGDVLPATIRIETSPDSADVYLHLKNNRIWFAGADGAIVTEGRRRSPSLSLEAIKTPEDAKALIVPALRAQLKVRNLIRAAETLGGGPAGQALEITAAIARAPQVALPAKARAPDDSTCAEPELDKLPDGVTPIKSAADLPALAHCDVVYFALRNTGRQVIDVTPLYIDGGGGIDYMGPGEGLRLLPDAPARVVPVTILTYDQQRGAPFPVGLERLLFVAVEQENKTSLPADFRYLAQPAMLRNTRKAGGPAALRLLLEEAAFATTRSRSASAGPLIGNAGIAQFRWKVVAPD